jgi:16S rRNA (guanine(966)-N(2))-methyltransferase RsmD
MRVITGKYRGRKLTAPKGKEIRPTTDKVKEALFSIIAEHVADADCVDLFGGTGSLGIEALSRGAQTCKFYDRSIEAVRVIKENLRAVGATHDEAPVLIADFRVVLRGLGKQSVDILFADPPYALGIYDELMKLLLTYDIMKPEGIVVLESAESGGPAEAYEGFAAYKKKRYGKTDITIFERQS